MEKDKKTSPMTTKTGKRKRINKEPEKDAQKIHPEQYEEFMNDPVNKEEAEKTEEEKNKDVDKKENKP